MKINEIKIKLVKIDGTNTIFGKGILNTETTLCLEQKGKIKKAKSRYHINAKHIKRDKKGKALCFIDLNTHKSFSPNENDKDIKTINQIQYVTQSANWEAHQNKMKISKWQILIYMFSGMGVFFLVMSILKIFGVLF
jgi:hypothetical protein